MTQTRQSSKPIAPQETAVVEPEPDATSATEREAKRNEELAKTPPEPGLHADTGAAQALPNALANSYPENDPPEEVEKRLKADSKAKSSSQDKAKK